MVDDYSAPDELIFSSGSLKGCGALAIADYKGILTEAVAKMEDCVCLPLTSGVYSLGGAVVIDRESGDYAICPGGNIEYKDRAYAIHGEESFVNRALNHVFSQRRLTKGDLPKARDILKDEYHTTIMFGIDNTRESASPCGNCRDLMKSYFDLETTLVANVRPDGKVYLRKLADYYVDDFFEADALDTVENNLLDSADTAFDRSYAFFSGLKEGCALYTQEGFIHTGAKMEDAAFHDTMAVLPAIDKSRETGEFVITRAAFVVADLDHISIPYKERQFLVEVDAMNRILGYEEPIEVLITDRNREKVFRTDSDEFMPFPFTVRRFNMGDGLEEYVRDLAARKP